MKFSTNTKQTSITTNEEGGISYNLSPKEKLVQTTTTCLFQEPKFYKNVKELMDESLKIVSKKDPEFILKLAAYCRNELYLRTISLYLFVSAANIPSCKPFVKKYSSRIIRRADEIYEVLACQLDLFGKPIPNSLKKSLANSFKNFDEYQFAKYNRPTSVKFKDIIKLTHPKEPSTIIKKILDGKLETPYTWETELSAKGNTAETWSQLIRSGRLPYMATLRNLNSMERANISDEDWYTVLNRLSDPSEVLRSKQFPFRFYSALKAANHKDPFKLKELKETLNKCLNTSVDNLPKLKGKTFISTDTSGSMTMGVSRKPSINHLEIGALMASMAHKFSDNAIVSVFGTNLAIADNLTSNILSDAQAIMNVNVGWSTNGWLVPDYLLKNKIAVERIILFTDEEIYGGNIDKIFNDYLKKVSPNTMLYVVNLNGHGNSCVNTHGKNVVNISGWSDKILHFIAAYEEGEQSFIKKIENY